MTRERGKKKKIIKSRTTRRYNDGGIDSRGEEGRARVSQDLSAILCPKSNAREFRVVG